MNPASPTWSFEEEYILAYPGRTARCPPQIAGHRVHGPPCKGQEWFQ
jgi:hypothetical protein